MEKKEPTKSDVWRIALTGIACLCILVLFWVASEISTAVLEIGINAVELHIAIRVSFVVIGLGIKLYVIYIGIGFVLVLIGALLRVFSPPLFERYRVFIVEKHPILFGGYRKTINALF